MVIVLGVITFVDSSYLRFSNVGIAKNDDIYGGGAGTTFPGMMEDPAPTYEQGSWGKANTKPAEVGVVLNNANGIYDAYLPSGANAKDWVNAKVDLYATGSYSLDQALSATDKIFTGVILEDGISISQTRVQITAIDNRFETASVIGGGTATVALYPNINEDDRNLPIPWMFGEYLDDGHLSGLRAIRISDQSNGTNGTVTYKVCSTPISSVTIYRSGNSTPLTPSSTNYSQGEFTLSESTVGDLTTSSILVSCTGYSSGDSGPASFHPVDVAYWYLTSIGSVAVSDINTASFTTAKARGDDIKVRRWLDVSAKSYAEVLQLCFEAGYNLFINTDGKYTIAFFAPGKSNVFVPITEHSLVLNSMNSKVDPDKLYASKIEAEYDYYNEVFLDEIEAEDNTLPNSLVKSFQFYFLYTINAVNTSIQRKLFVWKQRPEQITVEVPFENENSPSYQAILQGSLLVNFARYENQYALIRRITRDFKRGVANIDAISLTGYVQAGQIDGSPSSVDSPIQLCNSSGGGVPAQYVGNIW